MMIFLSNIYIPSIWGVLIWLVVVLAFAFLFWYVNKDTFQPPSNKKTSCKYLGDKSFIIDGKFVDLEQDTLHTEFQQREEDEKHYRDYVKQIVEHTKQEIEEEYVKTKFFIEKYGTEHKSNWCNHEAVNLDEKYELYLVKCSKLNIVEILTKEEFKIKEENLTFCGSFHMFIRMPTFFVHNIYNDRTAVKDINKWCEERFKKEYW